MTQPMRSLTVQCWVMDQQKLAHYQVDDNDILAQIPPFEWGSPKHNIVRVLVETCEEKATIVKLSSTTDEIAHTDFMKMVKEYSKARLAQTFGGSLPDE